MLNESATAPDFELPDLSGAPQTLKTLAAGSPLVLVFYRISCPVCQFAFPFLERIAKSTNLRIAGISQDDAAGTAEFHDEFGITFPSVIEKRGWTVGSSYRITNVPTVFVIEPGTWTISKAVTGFSKAAFEAISERAGLAVFHPDELIPAFRPG